MNCNSHPINLCFLTPVKITFENILIIRFIISIVIYSRSLIGKSIFKDSNNHFMKF